MSVVSCSLLDFYELYHTEPIEVFCEMFYEPFMFMNTKILFQEKQQFTQWWLWLLIIAFTCIPFYALWQQGFQDEAFGNNPMSTSGLFVFSVLTVLLVALFWFMQLQTYLDTKGIRMRFVPFFQKEFLWEEIESAEVINYGFVGGWGIRMGTNYGTVYNVKGNKGLFLKLKNGKKRLIGTQRPEELQKIVQEILN